MIRIREIIIFLEKFVKINIDCFNSVSNLVKILFFSRIMFLSLKMYEKTRDEFKDNINVNKHRIYYIVRLL